MGPSAVRYAGLQAELEDAGVTCTDRGDVTAPPAETQDADKRVPEQGRAKFVDEVEAVSHEVADEVEAAIADGATPLVVGGDHSVAIGSLRGAAADAVSLIEACEPAPKTVVLDGTCTQKVLDVAAQRGVDVLVATEEGEYVKQPTSVQVRTV